MKTDPEIDNAPLPASTKLTAIREVEVEVHAGDTCGFKRYADPNDLRVAFGVVYAENDVLYVRWNGSYEVEPLTKRLARRLRTVL